MKPILILLMAMLYCSGLLADDVKICDFHSQYRGIEVGKSTLDDAIAILGKATGVSVHDNTTRYGFGKVDITLTKGETTINTIIIADPDYTDLNGFNLRTPYDTIAGHPGILKETGYLIDMKNGVFYKARTDSSGTPFKQIVYAAQSRCTFAQDVLPDGRDICHYHSRYRGLEVGHSRLDDVLRILGKPRGMKVNSNNQRYVFDKVDVTVNDVDGVINTIIIRDSSFRDLNGFNLNSSYARIAAHPGIEKENGILVDRKNGVFYNFRVGLIGRSLRDIVYAERTFCTAQ